MNKFLLRWGINTIALYVAVQLLPGLNHTGSGLALLGVALIFGLINAGVKPIVVLLSCPLVLMTFGLYLLIINGLMLLFTEWVSDVLDLGFEVQSFGWAILGAIVIGLVSFVINSLIVDESQEQELAQW